MKYSWWTTYWGYVICGILGHKEPVTLLQKGNELCDCPADHTYIGCSRCRAAF